jgi:hypothetical protein
MPGNQKEGPTMAVREPRDLLGMLADRGEEAIQRLAETPGADRLLGVAQTLRERVDEMQKRMRGLDALEARIAELERRLEELSAEGSSAKSTSATTRKASATGKSSAAKKSTAAKKSSAAKKS